LSEKQKGLRRASQAPSTNKVSSRTSKLIASVSTPIKPFQSPEDARPAPWRDSDRAYFRENRSAAERFRLPYEGEFPAPGRSSYVHITVERDADGQPRRGRRRLRIAIGGNA
jgi:hypothetical protein